MTYNGIFETQNYNSLLQLISVTAGIGGPNYVNMQYNYPAPGSNNGKACLPPIRSRASKWRILLTR